MRTLLYTNLLIVTLCLSSCKPQEDTRIVQFWLTRGDRSAVLQRQPDLSYHKNSDTAKLRIDTTARFQTIDGFGYALTGGSALVIHQLPKVKREALLKELFSSEGIGVSYLRISMGASDLDDHVFSYDDLPAGKTDESLAHFTLEPDKLHLIPVLKEILEINPHLKIMASPWSPPLWMKTNNQARGGKLKPEFYGVYAQYFVRYIGEMKKEGITIDAVTIQNEPENPNNTPSMVMTAEEQAKFVSQNLGPAFRSAGVTTKIILFDHNCDHPEYPLAVLADDTARPFIDGSAFHLYLGDISAMGKVHDAFPDKNVYFTEQWTSGKGEFGGDLLWHTRNLTIGATRNWSKTVLEWNLASDPAFRPHTADGGCDLCMGALTIGDSVKRNVSYYIIAHASKFVAPGSMRIGSTESDSIPNVAFLTPEKKIILIAMNDSARPRAFSVILGGKEVSVPLPPASVATLVF